MRYNNYDDRHARDDEMGFDGITSNDQHGTHACMKPSVKGLG